MADKIRYRCHSTLQTDDPQAKRSACQRKRGHAGPHRISIIYEWCTPQKRLGAST